MFEPIQPRLRLVLPSPLEERAPVAQLRLAGRSLAASASRRPSRRPRRLRRVVLRTTALGATLASALMVADVRLRPEPAAAPARALEASVAAKPLVTQDGADRLTAASAPAVPQPLTPDTTSSAGRAVMPRRFVWAPVEGASGYHVELFRGNSLVFAADTNRPEITIPAKWKFDRREHRWESLAYRWYVWSIVAGERTTRAIVQAKLVVRDR